MARGTTSRNPAVDQGHSGNQEALKALHESQFVPFFQPIITLRTGQLSGFEMLGRWNHPTKGILQPSQFIDIAERQGWINELTWQLLAKAFAAVADTPNHLTLSINISPVQLRTRGVVAEVRRIADVTGFSLSRLIVEITESAMIENLQSAGAIVAEFKEMGCKLALDDFGTGYSSLHHLQSLPFDELKVDRSFVSSMIEKRESRKIVSAVIGLGQSLGLTNVAEGIETQEQAERMLWLGCELGQGYFFSPPIPADELANSILASRHELVTHKSSPWKSVATGSIDVSPSQRLAQLQAVYDGAPVGLAFVDQNLQYVNLNERLATIHQLSVEDHLGRKLSDIIPNTFLSIEPYLRRALRGEAIADSEVNYLDAGKTHLISYQPAVDEAGEVVGVCIAITDITDRKRTEEALKQSEHHYRNIVELNPQVLWVMDPQGRNLDVSPRWDKKTGLIQSRSANHDWLKLVHPDDIQPTLHSIARSRRNGESIRVEYRVTDADNNWRWKRSVGSPRFDANDNIICWYGSIQEIDTPGQTHTSAIDIKPIYECSELNATSIHVERSDMEARREALLDLEILDTPPEAEFDDLVFLASELCSTPMSAISLLDVERQWFKASCGLSLKETPIVSSFCSHTVEHQELFVVEDATKDARFKHNQLVTGEPHIRFYAGVPLYAKDGVGIGSLCIMDTVPRSLSPDQVKALIFLSQQVQSRLELRIQRKRLRRVLPKNLQRPKHAGHKRNSSLCA